MRYRRLRSLHFWLSLLLALPLTLASLTGALLVYAPEIQRTLSAETRTVTPAGEMLGFAGILERVGTQKPDLRVWSISVGAGPTETWTAWLGGGGGVLKIDPYDGRVLTHFRPRDTFEGWITALHRRWLAEGSAARWVRHGVSAVALLLIVQLAIGLWLWLLPPRPLRRLAPVARKGSRLTVLRLHQLTGVATALILAAVALTGMALYWRAPMKRIVEWASLSKVEAVGAPDSAGLAPVASLDAAIALARDAAGPDAELRHFRPPGRPGEPAVVTLGEPGQVVPTRVWVGDDPLRVLQLYDGTRASRARWLWHLRYPVHVGDFAGPLVRALWLFVALVPAGFVVSGLWLHFSRPSHRRRAAASRATAQPDRG